MNRSVFLEHVKNKQLEGRLFPETYAFRSDAKPTQIIERLTAQFEKVWRKISALNRTWTELDLLLWHR